MAFHHIHINDENGAELLEYYAKLFDPVTTKRTAVGDVRGIEADGIFLLVDPVGELSSELAGPVWHFGWGTVSLDEAYDRHRMQEIDLTLPMESLAKNLHLHIESADPLRAADWYRARFSADIATEAANARVRPPNPIHRRPAAIVDLPGIRFAIYQALAPLTGSRGRRIDHIAFTADLTEARAAGFTVLQPSGRLGPFETVTIEGPDRLAVELVAATRCAPGC